ncbi:flagellar assembly protein FliH [Pantoea sp. BAV 3049]|uniref:flagellar assembly protein FliH n=1 Tax=Pantoea sp. BAV 3049 TaxID=2654188 RepID=UPI00131A7F13|nr:flagellar assembly protein FliH [Pantoea sp. BAV 3049]
MNKLSGKYRLYHFPPLRKSWPLTEGQQAPLDAAEYQQQLMNGFQQGISDGFQQGVEQGKSQGYEEGLEQGLQAGREQGREEGKRLAHQEFKRAAEPLDSLVQQLTGAMEEYEQRRRSELLQLVEKVTRQVIRCELALQPTQLLTLVDEVLNSLPEMPKRLRVLMNPEEFARISETEPEKVAEWGLTAEPEMAPGECRVVTESAEMDVGCDHRLGQCMSVLTESLSGEQAD